MATMRLASATGSTYCGGADGDSRAASAALTLGHEAWAGLSFAAARATMVIGRSSVSSLRGVACLRTYKRTQWRIASAASRR